MTSVVWTCKFFENNFEINHEFAKYFKVMTVVDGSSDEQVYFKYFLNIALVREITKMVRQFGCYRHEWVDHCNKLKSNKLLNEMELDKMYTVTLIRM